MLYSYNRILEYVKLDTLVLTFVAIVGLQQTSTSASVKAIRRVRNASTTLLSNLRGPSFQLFTDPFSNDINSQVIREQPSIKRLQKLANLRNYYTSLQIVSYSYIVIVSTLYRSINTPSLPITKLRNSIESVKKQHFFQFVQRVYFRSLSNTSQRYLIYSSISLLQIRISSKQIIQNLSRQPTNALLIQA